MTESFLRLFVASTDGASSQWEPARRCACKLQERSPPQLIIALRYQLDAWRARIFLRLLSHCSQDFFQETFDLTGN